MRNRLVTLMMLVSGATIAWADAKQDCGSKRLKLLRQLMPTAGTIAYLMNPNNPNRHLTMCRPPDARLDNKFLLGSREEPRLTRKTNDDAGRMYCHITAAAGVGRLLARI